MPHHEFWEIVDNFDDKEKDEALDGKLLELSQHPDLRLSAFMTLYAASDDGFAGETEKMAREMAMFADRHGLTCDEMSFLLNRYVLDGPSTEAL